MDVDRLQLMWRRFRPDVQRQTVFTLGVIIDSCKCLENAVEGLRLVRVVDQTGYRVHALPILQSIGETPGASMIVSCLLSLERRY